MIFVTVGTNEAAFDRLVEAAGNLPGDEELVIQRGASRVEPARGEVVDFLPFDRLVDEVRRARVVITHAGVGSVMVALANGHRPIVVPRLGRLGEAVDDHQVTWGRRVAQDGLVLLVEDEADLAAAVQGGDAAVPGGIAPSRALVRELRAIVATA
jgi:UDP-N-acetylglucosamine transferase subunit ALG13